MNCSDCDAAISKQSRTGRCRRCALARLNADPTHQAKRTAGIRAKYEDATFRARQARALHARHMEARKDPEKAARLNANIHIARKRLADPDARAAFLASRATAARKRHETVMAWCPPRLRDLYLLLTRSKRLLAAEARAIIEPEITPFDRQLLAARRGARLVDKPVIRRADPSGTLGGVVGAII